MRRQFTIFLLSLLLISIFTLAYNQRALANWVLSSPTVVAQDSVKITLTPDQSATRTEATLEASAAQVQKIIALRLAQMKLKHYQVNASAKGVEVILPQQEN